MMEKFFNRIISHISVQQKLLPVFRNLYGKLHKYLNNISIRIKLLIFFLLLSIIPFFVMTLLNYNAVAREIKEQTLLSATQVFNDNVSMIKSKLNSVVEVSTLICLDDAVVQKVLRPKSQEYYEDYVQQNADYRLINDYIHTIEKYDFIKRVVLYVRNTYFFSGQNVNFYGMEGRGCFLVSGGHGQQQANQLVSVLLLQFHKSRRANHLCPSKGAKP